MGKDRRTNAYGKMEIGGIFIIAGISAGISSLIAYLFYNSVWGILSGIVITPMVMWLVKKEKEKKRLEELHLEFKDYLYAVSSALAAGYAVENAFRDMISEVEQLYGKEAILVKELAPLEKRLKLQEPIERILRDFAEKSGSEDVENFVEVFCYAKRGGGDFIRIIQTTVNRICDKIEVSAEVHTVLAEKALEQKVMCVVPIGVLVFFRLSSLEFIGILYGNTFGIVIMTLAWLLYAAAIFISVKIVEIEV